MNLLAVVFLVAFPSHFHIKLHFPVKSLSLTNSTSIDDQMLFLRHSQGVTCCHATSNFLQVIISNLTDACYGGKFDAVAV